MERLWCMQLEESTSVVVAGAAPGFVDCPAGQKVIMGAALHMQLNTFDGASTIKACQIGRQVYVFATDVLGKRFAIVFESGLHC